MTNGLTFGFELRDLANGSTETRTVCIVVEEGGKVLHLETEI